MNGDSRETGKLTPQGEPDPSVFSTDYNREGIRVGTAICVLVRKPVRRESQSFVIGISGASASGPTCWTA